MIKTHLFFRKSIKTAWFWGLLCTILVTGIYAATLSFRTMPAAEGWYTWYAQLINDGKVVYKDFSYLFFPFYIQLIALFTKIFGYSIFALRMFGILLFMGIGATSYTIFSKLTSAVGATIASIATVLYLQSEVVQIFYDYIRVMDLCAYLAVLFLVDYIIAFSAKKQGKFEYRIVLSAFFATLACMTKQSTGMLLLVYSIAFLIFLAIILDAEKIKRLLANTGIYIITVMAMFGIMFLWLWNKGALSDFFYNTTGNALDAKGGVLTVLFRWWGQELNNLIPQIWPSLLIIGSVGILLRLTRFAIFKRKQKNEGASVLLIGISTILVLAGLLLCRYVEGAAAFFNQYYPGTAKSLGFVCCMIAFFGLGIYLLYWSFTKGKFSKIKESDKEIQVFLPWFALLGAIFAIAYGVGISGGLAESQVALSIGFLIALIARGLENFRFWSAGMASLLLMTSFFTISCGARKYVAPYSWWGLNEGSIQEATYTSENPLLQGIKMRKADKVMYDGVVKIIQENTTADDTIFCFPHIPIIYALADRQAATYTQVQWFDMSAKADILRDMQTLEENPPKVIVNCELPEFVANGHEAAFNGGRVSQTRIMAKFLQDFVQKNDYDLQGVFPLCEGYTVSVYLRPETNKMIEHLDYRQYINPNYKEYGGLMRVYAIDTLNGWMISSTQGMEDLGESLGIDKSHWIENIKNSDQLNSALREIDGDLLIERTLYKEYLEEKPQEAMEHLNGYQCVAVTDDVAVLKNSREKLQLTSRMLSWEAQYGIYGLESLSNGAGTKDTNGIFLDRDLGAKGSFNWWQKNAQIDIMNYEPFTINVVVSFDIYCSMMNVNSGDSLTIKLNNQIIEIPLDNADGSEIIQVRFESTLGVGANRLYVKANNQQVTSATDSRQMNVMVANFAVAPVQ